ncbi:CAM [Linum perenne]
MEVLPGEVLREDQILEFEEAFFLLDKDGDGRITSQELGAALRSLGIHPTEGELKDMISEVDIDGKGSVGFGEFVSLMAMKVKENEASQEFRDAFRVFDKDQDGFISPNEVTHLNSFSIGIENQRKYRETVNKVFCL